MPTFLRIEVEAHRALAHLRVQAAAVRALLDELDRVAPPLCGALVFQREAAEQLAEEVGRLGQRMLECAAAFALENLSSESSGTPRLLHDLAATAGPSEG